MLKRALASQTVDGVLHVVVLVLHATMSCESEVLLLLLAGVCIAKCIQRGAIDNGKAKRPSM